MTSTVDTRADAPHQRTRRVAARLAAEQAGSVGPRQGRGAVLLAVWTGVGLLYMAFLDDGAVGDADRDRRPLAGGSPHADLELVDPLRIDAFGHPRQGDPGRRRRRRHGDHLAALARRRVPRRGRVAGGGGVRDHELHRRPRAPAGRATRLDPAVGELPVRTHRSGRRLLCRGVRRRVLAHAQPPRAHCLRLHRRGRPVDRRRSPAPIAACTIPSTSPPACCSVSPRSSSCGRRIAAGVDEIDRTADASVPARVRRLDLTVTGSRRAGRSRPHVWSTAMTTSTTHRAERLPQGRRGRPSPSATRHRRPASAGSPRVSCTACSACSRCRSRSRACRRIEPGAGRARPASSARSPRSPTRSFGALALWIIAIGLALYVIWRLISILLPAEHTAKAWLTRGGYLVSAIMLLGAGVDGGVVRHVTIAPRTGRRARTPRSSASRGN